MGFLKGVADWCRIHIPLVGDWIARVIELAEDAIEAFVNRIVKPIADFVWGIIHPWLERIDEFIHATREIAKRLDEYVFGVIKGTIEWITNGLKWLTDMYHTYVLPHIEGLLYNVGKILSDIGVITGELAKKAGKWVEDHVKLIKDWWDWFTKEFSRFLSDPVGYIREIAGQEVDSRLKTTDEEVETLKDENKALDISLGEIAFWNVADLLAWFADPFWTLIKRFISDLLDYHIDMETLEVVEPEPPEHIKVLVEKREFK